ncbi:porin [Burkholderia sp. L27(2015)]|uniref:porin n=1 Tax=Burkholderia sp. L27(2015) TaxID=1641858 RepID=UPI00349EE74B
MLLVLAPLCLSAGAVHAQSSVTLYGLVDEGLLLNTNAKNVVNGTNIGGRQLQIDSVSGTNGSRWGLRGSEDLGGGLHTVFTLESGVNLSNGAFGQGNTPFGRQAYVGLGSDKFGTVTLGRQYTSIKDFVGPFGFALAYGGSITEHVGNTDDINDTFRLNNTIKYTSPDFNGLTFGGAASLGGVAGQVSQASAYMLGAAYNRGPLGLGAGYEFFKSPSATGGILNDNVAGLQALNSFNAGYLGTNPASAQQNIAVGGSYEIGATKLGVVYTNTKYLNIGAFHGATATINNFELNAKYQFNPSLYVAGDYNYTKGNAVSGKTGDQKYNQFSMKLDYALSKRTDVYLLGTFQQASGTNSLGSIAVADIGNLGDSSNNHQAVARAAIRHRF